MNYPILRWPLLAVFESDSANPDVFSAGVEKELRDQHHFGSPNGPFASSNPVDHPGAADWPAQLIGRRS
jgi:hypothetical protein